jgi:hypothetical protein
MSQHQDRAAVSACQKYSDHYIFKTLILLPKIRSFGLILVRSTEEDLMSDAVRVFLLESSKFIVARYGSPLSQMTKLIRLSMRPSEPVIIISHSPPSNAFPFVRNGPSRTCFPADDPPRVLLSCVSYTRFGSVET